MEQLKTSFSVVMPLLIMMAVGYTLKRTKILTEDTFRKVNKIIFYVGLPALVFWKIVQNDFVGSGLRLALWIVGAAIVLFLVTEGVALLCIKDPMRRGVMVQAVSRTNDAVFGLAVMESMILSGALPASGMSVMAFAVGISAPIFNITGVLALELNRGGKFRIGKLLLGLAKNPILWALLAAFLFKWTGLTLPTFLASPIERFSQMCTPLAFLVLGGILSFGSLRDNRKPLLFGGAAKLLLVPAVVVLVSYWAGFRGAELLSILVIFAAPTAMSSFPLACELGGDTKLAGEMVAVTTAFSLPTMFLFLTIFGGLL